MQLHKLQSEINKVKIFQTGMQLLSSPVFISSSSFFFFQKMQGKNKTIVQRILPEIMVAVTKVNGSLKLKCHSPGKDAEAAGGRDI